MWILLINRMNLIFLSWDFYLLVPCCLYPHYLPLYQNRSIFIIIGFSFVTNQKIFHGLKLLGLNLYIQKIQLLNYYRLLSVNNHGKTTKINTHSAETILLTLQQRLHDHWSWIDRIWHSAITASQLNLFQTGIIHIIK